jgi:hypothetical protein
LSDGNNSKPRIQAEMLVGVSAVFIGLCALAVSLYEAKLMREEQRSAVLPILELSRSYYVNDERDDSEWRLLLQAENVGIGPARVLDFRVTVDGKAHPTWASAMGAMLGRGDAVRYGQSTINGRTIPPARSVTMFDLANTELAAELVEQWERLDFEACYCSVFDECWETAYSAFGSPVAVDACVPGEDSFNE